METMALDEMDPDDQSKRGRELREDTIIRKEREIKALREEIEKLRAEIEKLREEMTGVSNAIVIAPGIEARKAHDEQLQLLRQQISSRDQQISSRDQQISSRDQQISSRDQQISTLMQETSTLMQEKTSLRSAQEASASAGLKPSSQVHAVSSGWFDSPVSLELVLIGPYPNVLVGKFRELTETALPAEPPWTAETIKKLVGDAMKEYERDSAVKNLSMSSISTEVAGDVLKMAGFSIFDGSAIEPPEEAPVSSEWKFDMGQYASEADCYGPLFNHMVNYLNGVHNVEIRKDPPYPRGVGCCRLLDVHKDKKGLELEAELGDLTLKMTGNLDAVFVPPRCGAMQYKEYLLGGVEVKHSAAHKELFKRGAPADDIANSGRSGVPGQALMEALAVYAHSDFPTGIFLLTSYDENAVMELKDGEMLCWAELNFAQAMDKIAAFLKGESVRDILDNFEKPVGSREGPHISERKRSVRKKLKVEGLGNEEFLEQVNVIRSAARNKQEMVSDLFQLMESWRYRTTEACGSAGPLSYFS